MRGADLMSMFNVFIRPIIEFCSVVYHPLLTVRQSEDLERMQRQAVRLAYGWEKSYATVCSEAGILTLKKRREDYIDRFVIKALRNDRYRDSWFPTREEGTMSLRTRREFFETRSRTERYFNSPLSFMRRRANVLRHEGMV